MTTQRGVAVGVAIGSTHTLVALIDQEGQVLRRLTAKTLRGRPALATLEPYIRAIDMLCDQAQTDGMRLCGIGVSVPGTVDSLSLRPQMIPSLPSLNNFPLSDYLSGKYRLPSFVHADVDAAILAEHCFGAGRNHDRLLYLTVNAVVGASLVIDGRLEQTTKSAIGHISHVSLASSGPRCSCGKYGCVNTLISFDALVRTIQRALRRGAETSLTRRLQDRDVSLHRVLAEEAARGDNLAVQIYRDFARWLGAAIQHYINLFAPDIFILGGDMLHTDNLLLSQIHYVLETKATSRVSTMVKIVPALLGSDVALIGSVTPLF